MSKIKKIDRIAHLEFQVTWLTNSMNELLGTEGLEFEPQLKQLDQSVFDGLDEKWRWVARDHNGDRYAYAAKPYARDATGTWVNNSDLNARYLDAGYDDENWQNSLIERSTAKEPAEVGLSSELTGSELCKAMLARGDKYVMCQCWDSSYADIEQVVDVINGFECTAYRKLFAGSRHSWEYAVPINNQGEPLTASEAGL